MGLPTKKKKTEAKAAAKVDDDAQVEKVIGKRRAGEEGTSRKKKKKKCQGTPTIDLDSKHVSSPILINHSKPLETLANEVHVSKTASPGWLDDVRNQTDEQGSPRRDMADENVDDHTINWGGRNEHGDANLNNEGHGDNAERLSGLRTQPSLAIQLGMFPSFIFK
ncbi:hypothetical protein Tco_0802374 [Tanacetum coccineum]|uniref:Uncharacterized protein n=1 Tax=Tanacetum coccineum TaxID=301880 RepID=A0ABQ5A1J1_9ASTR